MVKQHALTLARAALLLAAAMLGLSAAGLAVDLYRAGGLAALGRFDLQEARHLTNIFSRASNQLMGIVFTAIAIAVPLTANMYSLKFLDFFIRDRINAAVLGLIVFASINTTLVSWALREGFVPRVALHLQLGLMVLGGSLLFPYVYYVFRFLHPNTLLARLEQEIASHLAVARSRPGRAADQRRPVGEGLDHIANVAVRSVDRLDRNTAIESVLALERALRGYWRVKAELPAEWFLAETPLFLSFSTAALDEMRASRSWVEMKTFAQLRQVVASSIPSMPDLTSAAAKALRRLGLDDAARNDVALRELVMEHFNTFIRLALNRRDVRAVFILFDQYRAFAEALNAEHPDLVVEIAYYFEYYAQAALAQQLTFVVEAVAHDLGALVRHAWETGAGNREALLDRFLGYASEARPLAGVKKAQAILASYFLLSGQPGPAGRIRRSFAGLEPSFVARLADELLAVQREKYWEVSERRLNLEYVPPAQRERLREFLQGLPPPALERAGG